MTNDIEFCGNKECPLKGSCRRSQIPNNNYYSCGVNAFERDADGQAHCKMFKEK